MSSKNYFILTFTFLVENILCFKYIKSDLDKFESEVSEYYEI